MKFLFLVCRDDAVEAQAGEIARAVGPWFDDAKERGVLLEGHPLAPVEQAVTVRVREGKARVEPGPFARTSERIVGFDVMEFDSVQEALEEARRHPMAPYGAVEVRAFEGDDA